MKKTVFIILIFILTLLYAETFNPITPEIHSLIWKSVKDPEVVYFLDSIGLRPENFADTYYQTFRTDSYEVQVMLKKDKIWNIKLTFPDPATAEKASKPILKHYGLSHIYKEPDHKKWKDEDDRFGEGSIEQNMKSGDDYLSLTRFDENNKEMNQVYYKKQDDKYIVEMIFIYGEFSRKYKKQWQEKAEKYYSTISDARKNDIANAFSDDPEVKKAVAQKAKRMSKPEIAAEMIPELSAKAEKMKEMKSVTTIWDQYIKSEWTITKLTEIFSIWKVSASDLEMLENKFGFEKSYYRKYSHPEKKYTLQFEKAGEYYRLAKIIIPNTYESSYPSIGLEDHVDLAQLENKFGLCWYKNVYYSPYTIHASGHSAKNSYNLNFSFERKEFSESINNIVITLNDNTKRDCDGNIKFKKGECLWGDCENGKGIYKYTNDKWIIGLFKDGKNTHGYAEDYDPLKVVEEIGHQERHPFPYGRRLDDSIWGKLLTHKIGLSAMTWAFNKKDYTNEDWNILRKNYWFKYDSEVYRSPDEKISLITSSNGRYIKGIVLYIDSEDDLKSLGFAKHYTKEELEKYYGYEYIRYGSYYNVVMIPEGDDNKENHILLRLNLDTNKNLIKSASLKPFNPEKIKIGKTLRYIETGVVNKPDVTYQFADGARFIGKVHGGIPSTGSIYAYNTDVNVMNLKSFTPDRGFAPDFIKKAEKMRDPVLKHMDQVAREMNAFREDEKKMANSMLGYMEKPEDTDLYRRWVNEAASEAEKHVRKARLHVDNIFTLVEGSDLGCSLASTDIARIFTSLSYFQDLIDTARKIVRTSREKTIEYEEFLKSYNKYDQQLKTAYDSLIDDLNKCGYFEKMYEIRKKKMKKQ